jgi:glycosyltransferase involved in cell wall biosynthesis
MRILWISEFPPDSGGLGDYSRHVVEGLAERGHEIDLLTSSSKSPDLEEENIHYLGEAPARSGLEWRKYLSDDYDIVCLKYPGIRSVGLTKYRLISKIDAASVLVTHESISRLPLIPMLTLFNDFGFLSDRVREDFEEFSSGLPLVGGVSHMFPYQGVDPDLEDRLEEMNLNVDLDDENVSVVCPGFIVDRKNYHLAAESFNDVIEEYPDAELVFAGGSHRNENSDALEKVEDAIEENGLGENARITGVLESEMHVYEYIRKADVVLLPYENINQSGILARSLALGKPTVVSDVDGLADPVRKYGGRIFSKPEELGKTVIEEIRNPSEIDSERVLEDMSWEKNIEEYEEMFREISEKSS